MMIQVTVSGSVGKQVFATTKQVNLGSVLLSPSGANATIKIRDGNASGEVVLFARATSANGSLPIPFKHKFTKGMHVKIIGTNAEAYLEIN